MIKQIDDYVWQVRIDTSFSYEELPKILESSLSIYEIKDKYQVAVRKCDDGNIVLGYHKYDFLFQTSVPCKGREREKECYFIEITFLATTSEPIIKASSGVFVVILIGGLIGLWYFNKRKNEVLPNEVSNESDLLNFGNTKLDFAGQTLYINGKRLSLTYREAKLLKLFAIHFEQLLERNFIIQEVWADEGVLVGRSVDVFVSRLRKKINSDPSIGIVSVNGVGYRLETIVSA
jgi:DNA-binding winged helix-turn-helix (wHTH) protein